MRSSLVVYLENRFLIKRIIIITTRRTSIITYGAANPDFIIKYVAKKTAMPVASHCQNLSKMLLAIMKAIHANAKLEINTIQISSRFLVVRPLVIIIKPRGDRKTIDRV